MHITSYYSSSSMILSIIYIYIYVHIMHSMHSTHVRASKSVYYYMSYSTHPCIVFFVMMYSTLSSMYY